jgi:hypothetical protein
MLLLQYMVLISAIELILAAAFAATLPPIIYYLLQSLPTISIYIHAIAWYSYQLRSANN